MQIALVGNPNCGKSTLFNRLTGMRQKTSNLPGTTVEQKQGIWKTNLGIVKLVDLPGLYSLFSKSEEEKVVVSQLLGMGKQSAPDKIIFVLDATNVRRNLLLFTQVAELNIPMIIAITMDDTAVRRGITIQTEVLQAKCGVPVITVNPKNGVGISALAETIDSAIRTDLPGKINDTGERLVQYMAGANLRGLSTETLQRYKTIETILSAGVIQTKKNVTTRTQKLDKIFIHKIWGFFVFAAIMLTIFQGVFTVANYPMGWMERGFGEFQHFMREQLTSNFFTDMFVDGIIPGLAGVLIFLPQIAILFFFISLLEDSGYMVRASFITDKIMRRIGLNGRSVIPLIGGFACAIPSILATRSIKNRRERLATMFVIPLMSCSARLPVYVLLISLAIPVGTKFGPFGMQSLVMTLAYFAGIIAAIIIAFVISLKKNTKDDSEFILEMPPYQLPRLQNVWSNVVYKSGSFVKSAGKIIVIISVVLWFLSSHGPGDAMKNAGLAVQKSAAPGATKKEIAAQMEAAKLESSFAGLMGQWIEPAIAPLGYDWRTGIALISSFAAREVFVGTMNTLFNAGGKGDVSGIRDKMMKAKNPKTGKPLYGGAYAFSLIIFYAFALQCMSTMAVMRKETGNWKLPIIQFFSFGIIAWIAAWIVYNISLLV